MRTLGKAIFFVVILSLLLSGCTTQCNDIHQRLQPGMTYEQISKEFGNEGERYTVAETEPQTVVYQWYVDDYMRVIMYFSSADQKNDLVLYKYDITYGCSYFTKGMTYQELFARLGTPQSSSTFFDYAGMIWKIHDCLYLSVQFEKQDNIQDNIGEIYTYPDDYIAINYEIRTTDVPTFG